MHIFFYSKNSLTPLAKLKRSNFIEKKLQHSFLCFPVKFTKFLKRKFFTNTSGGCFWHIHISLYLWFSSPHPQHHLPGSSRSMKHMRVPLETFLTKLIIWSTICWCTVLITHFINHFRQHMSLTSYLTLFSIVSSVNFEQVFVCRVWSYSDWKIQLNLVVLDFKKYLYSQLTFTCLKSTIETLEKGVKYVKSQ